ncbi:MAG: YHYH protein [Cyanobacteria bacterium J06632_22]
MSVHILLGGAAVLLAQPTRAHPPTDLQHASAAEHSTTAVSTAAQMLLELEWVSAINHPAVTLAQSSAPESQPSQNQVQVEIRDGYRYITSNGIPNHTTGTFPNPGNPNQISEQNHAFRMTLSPQYTGTATPARPVFGIALNGVPFEPGTAEFWNRDRNSGWNYDALSGRINLGTDQNNAHVQPTGSYHYHGLPIGLLNGEAMTLIGYAADGFPIYGQYGYADAGDASSGIVKPQSSYQLKAGQRPSGPGGTYDGTFVEDFEYVAGLGDLDECNGRFGVTPEHPEGIYHYYVTETFPFVPRCVMGTADASFSRPAATNTGRDFGSGSGVGSRPESGSRPGPGRPPRPSRRN